MKSFRIRHDSNEEFFQTRFRATLTESKDEVSKDELKHLRANLIVEEVDVKTDKAGVLAALNGEPIISRPTRTYGVTARGALKAEN